MNNLLTTIQKYEIIGGNMIKTNDAFVMMVHIYNK